MDDQIAAIRNAIKALDDVDKLVAPGSQQKDIAGKIDVFLDKLKLMHASGSDNYFPVPLDALKFLDETEGITNPWHYVHRQVEAVSGLAGELAAREQYYEDVKVAVEGWEYEVQKES